MYAVSAKFLDALTRPHILARQVDAFLGTTLLSGNIPISGGTVTADRGSRFRWSLSLTVSDIALMPRQPGDPLAIYGNTLRVQRGIQYQDGTVELAPCGVYRIDAPKATDRDMGPVTVTGKSLEAVVADEPWLTPFTTAGQISCFAAIDAIIRQAIPDAVITNLATNNPAPATLGWDITSSDDRWKAVEMLAAAMGAECYADASGHFVVRDLPNLNTAVPAWTVAAGEGGALVTTDIGMDRTKVRNGWRVTGGNAADRVAPVSALVVDSSPSSPTRWGGPMGHLLGTHESSLLTTVGQCEVVAESLLRNSLGADTAISLSAVPNPALEPGDCIRVVNKDGTKRLHIVQSLSLPLTAGGGAFTITTFSREDTTP